MFLNPSSNQKTKIPKRLSQLDKFHYDCPPGNIAAKMRVGDGTKRIFTMGSAQTNFLSTEKACDHID